MKIGFIGLGSMGGPIARRLARTGHAVIGCDVSPEALAAFDEPGTTREADPLEAARQADVLGVCVRTDAQLEDLLGDGRLFAALGAGGLCILNSTVAPALARKLGALAASHGIDFVDVGVSGGEAYALEGKLSLFVGGEEPVIARARPILDAMGVVAWLGPVGRGQEGKLINNILSIANFGMAALAIELGERLAFDREQLRTALLLGSARSFSLEVLPGMADWKGEREPAYFGWLHDLLAKDVSHAAGLVPEGEACMAALVASAQAMLDTINRTAATRRSAA